MAELVKIPLASTEYQARFERPYVGFIGHDRLRAFEAILTALLPFQLRLAETEIVTTGTLADHKTIFKMPERGIRFEFGAEEYRFSKDGSSWTWASKRPKVSGRKLAARAGPHESSKIQCGIHSSGQIPRSC